MRKGKMLTMLVSAYLSRLQTKVEIAWHRFGREGDPVMVMKKSVNFFDPRVKRGMYEGLLFSDELREWIYTIHPQGFAPMSPDMDELEALETLASASLEPKPASTTSDAYLYLDRTNGISRASSILGLVEEPSIDFSLTWNWRVGLPRGAHIWSSQLGFFDHLEFLISDAKYTNPEQVYENRVHPTTCEVGASIHGQRLTLTQKGVKNGQEWDSARHFFYLGSFESSFGEQHVYGHSSRQHNHLSKGKKIRHPTLVAAPAQEIYHQ